MDVRLAVAALLFFALQDWQAGMLHLQNQLRARHQLAPLHWSDDLAQKAQQWADRLLATGEFRHDPSRHGQNLFAVSNGNATAEFVFNAWASEASSYNYETNTCSDVCGHYTQIVWRDTTEIGCAVARDSRREVWVCDYNPPGNINNARPY